MYNQSLPMEMYLLFLFSYEKFNLACMFRFKIPPWTNNIILRNDFEK